MYAVFVMTDSSWGRELDHTVQLFSDEAAAVAWAVDLLVASGEIEKRGEAGWGLPGEEGLGFRNAAEALYAWHATCNPLEFLHVYQVVDHRSKAAPEWAAAR